jgi:hypothetical protein
LPDPLRQVSRQYCRAGDLLGLNCTPLTQLLQECDCGKHFTTKSVIVKIAPFMFQEMKRLLKDQLIS